MPGKIFKTKGKEKMKNKDIQKDIKKIMQDWDWSNAPDVVKVVWEDAHTNKNTLSYKDIKEERLIQAITIGFLMDEKEEHIVVCGFLFPDPNKDLLEPDNQTAFRDVHIIPKSQIKSILVLETDWEESKKYREPLRKKK
jgi:hypothetical protein